MDEFERDRNLRESRGGSKSPVKVKVKLFEKNREDDSPTKRQAAEQSVYRRSSSTKSKSPGWGNKPGYDSDQDSVSGTPPGGSLTRSKSPAAKHGGMSLPLNNPHNGAAGGQEWNSPTETQTPGNWRRDKVYTPTRSTSANRPERHESSPMRSKSPGSSTRENSGSYSPNRSKSPGVIYHGNSGSYSPNRSKSPLVSYQGNSDVYSPTRNRSPGNSRQKTSGTYSPNRSKSPGVANQSNSGTNAPTRSKSPGVIYQGNGRSPGNNNQMNSGTYSPNRSKSPGVANQDNSGTHTPDRSKSPAVSYQGNVYSPNRSKSPGVSSQGNSGVYSPIGSKSLGASSVHSSVRSVSSTVGSPVKTRQEKTSKPTSNESAESSKPPLTNNDWRDEMSALFQSLPQDATERDTNDPGSPQTRSISPSKIRRPNSFAVSDTRRGSRSKQSFSSDSSPNKWVFNGKTWEKDEASPDVTWDAGPGEKINSEGPTVGDTVNISWFLNNDEIKAGGEINESYVEPTQIYEEQESPVSKATEEIFQNTLIYNLTEWERGASYEKNRPKKADEFIQNMCDQVRNQVEYFCGKNFYSYEALSYKVKITGPTGILYYIKVCVSPSNCLHLRVFSDKTELKATPSLQAILERTQIDNGNISYF